MKEEVISEENEINGKNVEMGSNIAEEQELEKNFEIEDPNNDPDYSKNGLPIKSVTYIGHEDEICVNEFKPFPCGFCYDIYTEENELRKHIDTIHHGENI